MNVIRSALRPVKGRMRVLRAVRCICWGLMAGAALCAAILLTSFLVPLRDRALYLLLAALCPPALAGLAGLLWPVGTARAARRADDCGLKERVQTALAVQNRQDDMARLLRRDALRSLQTLRVRKAMPVRAVRLPLYIAAGLVLACSAMLLIPNPQDAVLRAQRHLQQKIAAQQEKLNDAQKQLEQARLTDKQLQELRRILGDLARETGRAKDQREAMTSISRAQEQLNRLLNEGKNAAMDALAQQGLDSLAQAMAQAQGDASQALEDAMQGMDQQALSQALADAAEQAAAGDMADAAAALNAAAQAAASGSISGAAQALAQLTSASMAASQMSAALQSAKTAVSGAAQSAAGQSSANGNGNGSGQGAGQGNGQGKGAGTGAGKGSTNEDAGYSQSSGAQRQAGSGMAQYKTGQYESIYDPTRLGDGGEISQSTGKVTQNGEHTQLQLTPGLGNTQGSVPYDQVAGEYRDAAVQSAQQDNLPDYARQWVNDYFTALLDQQ